MPVYKSTEKTKDGNSYYYSIHYVDSYGKSHRIKSKKYKTKKDAEKAEAKKLLELDKLPSETLTFNQVALAFLPEKQKKVKLGSYKAFVNALNHALDVLGDIQVDKLTNHQYEQFLRHLDGLKRNGKAFSGKTKNRSVSALKQLIQFSYKRYNLTTSVPSKYDNYIQDDNKEMKFITLDQFKELMEVVDDEVYSALFVTLFFMGLRIGEANGLQFKNVDFENNTLSVKQTVTTKIKTDKYNYLITTPKTKSSIRTLPLPKIVSKKLLEMYDYHSNFEGFNDEWFVFGGYRPIPETTIQKAKTKYFRLADLEEIRLHDFRHSCASYLINNGATPLLVSRWLGHASVTMTLNRYSHLYKSELDDIVQNINQISL